MSLDLPLHTILGWLFSVTVKGSIVVLFIAAVQLVIGGRIPARWRHTLWLLALLRLMAPVAPASSFSLFNLFPLPSARQHLRVVRPLPPQVMTDSRIEAALRDPQSLQMTGGTPLVRWLLAVWLLGVGLLALRMLISSLRMRRAVNRSRRASAANPYLEGLLLEAVQRVGVPRWVVRMHIFESGVVRTPALHGLRKTTLLLPRGMSGTFTRDELRHVILHELWHVRRFDIGISWLLSVTQAVHWFNPFVWFATSRIKEERELACDELALSCLEEEERLSYGTTILKLLERFRMAAAPVPALVGIVNHKQKMKRRLTMIASYKNRSRFSLIFVAVLAFGARFYKDIAKLTGNRNPFSLFGAFRPAHLDNENGRINILVAGNSADDAGHNGASLTDSIMVMSVNTRNNTAMMLSVPRDLWVNVPGNGHSKINAAYTYGGMDALKGVIEDNLDIPIHYTVLVNYSAFRDLVNAVGGITIKIDSPDRRGIYD
ncbi:MAG: M56 family metallopeptidase, partial [Acidobacteriota bacterium]